MKQYNVVVGIAPIPDLALHEAEGKLPFEINHPVAYESIITEGPIRVSDGDSRYYRVDIRYMLRDKESFKNDKKEIGTPLKIGDVDKIILERLKSIMTTN